MALKEYIVDELALDCAEGLVSRREAVRRLGLMGLSGAAAATLLAACGDDDDAAPPTAGSSDTGATTPASTSPPASTVATTAAATSEEIRFGGPSGELLGVVAEAGEPVGRCS